MPVIGSLFLIVGMMWFADRRVVLAEIYGGKSLTFVNIIFLFWLRWVIPIILLFILLGTLYELVR